MQGTVATTADSRLLLNSDTAEPICRFPVHGSEDSSAMPQVLQVNLDRALKLSGAVLLTTSFLWLGVGLVHVYEHPVLGWIPLPLMAILAAHTCRRASRDARFDAGTRRFWLHMSVACVVLAGGILSNVRD